MARSAETVEKDRARCREYARQNKERMRTNLRNWRKKNKDKSVVRNREGEAKTPEQIERNRKTSREWARRNRERVRAYWHEWHKKRKVQQALDKIAEQKYLDEMNNHTRYDATDIQWSPAFRCEKILGPVLSGEKEYVNVYITKPKRENNETSY